MILLINGSDRARYGAEIAKMHRLRKKVFHDRLGWDVRITDDEERDCFDDLDPLYVLNIEQDTGQLLASLRLLPTTGPNMLCDIFPQLLTDGLRVRSATIWESSRFCVDHQASQDRSANRITVAAAELMCSVGEMGLASGMTHIVTVTDLFLERIFRKMGCAGERLGLPQRVGKVDAVGVYWEVSMALLGKLKDRAGICSPLTSHGQELAAV